MTTLGWLLAGFFCMAWFCTEYERRQLQRLNRAYEQHMRNKLMPYKRIEAILNKRSKWDLAKLNYYKARAIVKKSEAHKLIKLKVVDE